jgi:hypothetical protein
MLVHGLLASDIDDIDFIETIIDLYLDKDHINKVEFILQECLMVDL